MKPLRSWYSCCMLPCSCLVYFKESFLSSWHSNQIKLLIWKSLVLSLLWLKSQWLADKLPLNVRGFHIVTFFLLMYSRYYAFVISLLFSSMKYLQHGCLMHHFRLKFTTRMFFDTLFHFRSLAQPEQSQQVTVVCQPWFEASEQPATRKHNQTYAPNIWDFAKGLFKLEAFFFFLCTLLSQLGNSAQGLRANIWLTRDKWMKVLVSKKISKSLKPNFIYIKKRLHETNLPDLEVNIVIVAKTISK